LNSRVIELE